MYDFANFKYVRIPQLVTIQFSLASMLSYVLIQNGQMTLNSAHQKTLTFSTQTPSSLCNKRSREILAAFSHSPSTHHLGCCALGVCVSCIPVQNSGYSTTFKWAVSSDLSANSSNHINHHLSTHTVQEFPRSLRTTSNSRCLCTKFSHPELDTSGETHLRLPPLKKYSSL
jgi:hypothetical protein